MRTDKELLWAGLTKSQVALCKDLTEDEREEIYYNALKGVMEQPSYWSERDYNR